MALGLPIIAGMWWVLRQQFASANVWLKITLVGWALSVAFRQLPNGLSHNQLISNAFSFAGMVLAAWAFWKIMEAERALTPTNAH